jgi:hypothetical protein
MHALGRRREAAGFDNLAECLDLREIRRVPPPAISDRLYQVLYF